MSFSVRLLEWYKRNKRPLPWRETNNPYVIWLSEIILQQTRVDQGLPYFLRFVSEYPNVTKFALAEEDEILRMWQGLGYYSRARNMHKAAKEILHKFGGQFPTDYQELLSLPGIGEYTAAAIASFSVNGRHAVLDGNVYRVLARYFGIDEPVNTPQSKKLFRKLADELLDEEHPAEYNQAIMDFGALQCKPKQPLCEQCPMRIDCVAFQAGTQSALPRKIKSKPSRDRYFNYFVVQRADCILMAQRPKGDIWTSLYEFPLIESEKELSIDEMVVNNEYISLFGHSALSHIGTPERKVLSHQNIYARFYRVEANDMEIVKKSNWNYFLLEKIDKLAKHKLISSFIERNF